ncbi:hypothetical protein JCM15124A_18100 [Prevotella falsenii]
MSNGERYDRNDFTCAHRTLPFGTRLKVTNTKNGKEVEVRVTDRGPYSHGRIVDLSYAAAREIGMVASGVAYIKVEVLPKETEIPYAAEQNGLKMPEVEYGFAGVCYEFIPEWEAQGKDDKPKTIERKVKTSLQPKKNTHTVTPPTKTNSNNKPAQKPVENKRPTQQKSNSKSWTNFFKNVKKGITSLFE